MLATTLSVVVMAAGGFNDWHCEPRSDHPFPTVLVHGRGGTAEGFPDLVAALSAEGYCVFATDYGQVNGQGQHGVDHLWVSAAQIDDFIEQVLAATGAERVDVIGHSAGTGVLANLILARGGAEVVHRMISFGGLHHPYAHAGAPGFVDNDLFLPNLIAAARLVDPDLTAQQVIVAALDLYVQAGGTLAGIDAETATSNFASDLFDPSYWTELHGGLSEPPTTFIKIATDGRALATADAAPTVCYTNFVGVGDLLTGPSAGFQDPAPNVDNLLLESLADHAQILADPVALEHTLDALGTPCPFTDRDGEQDPTDESGDPDSDHGGFPDGGGCSAGGVASPLVALALLGLVRRRRPR
jgi:pimeloyl-ACP methyl ester carboxylesterase